ncbi:MAG: hypothetical protein ABJP70_07720 [Erythrobacter sp.]
MTLEDFYFLSQIVAAVGIMLSLIFVGIQMRQSTEQAKRMEEGSRVAAMREAHGNLANWYMHTSQNQQLASLIDKALNDFDTLSVDELGQYVTSASALLCYAQNAFFDWRAGDLPDEQWRSWYVALQFVNTPGGARLWAMRRHMFADPFVDYFENEVMNSERPEVADAWFRRKHSADVTDEEASA